MRTPHIKVRNPDISGPPKYKYTSRYVVRDGKLVNVNDLPENRIKKVLTGM